MLKKKAILAFMSGLLIQSVASAGVKEAAFQCVYFTCPAILLRVTGVSYLLENIERNKQAQKIVAATEDANFFKSHVIQSNRGELANDLYNKLVIHVAPGDVVTQSVQVKHTSGDGSYYYTSEDALLEVDTTQPILLENRIATGVKINGRALISPALAEAHLAVQFLIFSDALVVKDTDRTQYSIATDALSLNEIAIMFAHKK
ncbi:hypothetical protein [Bdellovibrio svalbardensis]|uniref:FAS1 domain-containing protein n=1 Tax=Bdellovibrio svalbardensis TaxID=2972972 RepID=A0ABT6DE37_9BACT|nr:hypothetical protein [Bdellovibrio svalbardensis]MDG0815092.1 hypothetical protein [Bdellovibrio svalbardensis]